MAHMSMVQSLPLKKQNTDDYFSGTKQSKNKGKRKKKTEIVINLKELERPLLEAAAQQKPVLSDQRSGSACRQQTPGEHCYKHCPKIKAVSCSHMN